MRPNESQRTVASEGSLRRASFYNLSFDYYGEAMDTNWNDQQSLNLGQCQMLDAEKVSGENGNISEPNSITANINDDKLRSRDRTRVSNQISKL